MCSEPTDANYAAYFAEDLIEYALKYRCIFWDPQRPVLRKQQYLMLPEHAKFNVNIGHALLMVHAKYESYVKADSTEIWRDIKSGLSSKEVFMNFIKKSYEISAPNLEFFLYTVAVVVSSCVPFCRNGLFEVIIDAVWCIRDAVLMYPKRAIETIIDLQFLASKMRIGDPPAGHQWTFSDTYAAV